MPTISAVGKRRPTVDDQEPVLVLDDRHVLADLADPAERQDAHGSGCHQACAVSSRPWRTSASRTTSTSSSLASTSGRRGMPTGWPSRPSPALIVMASGPTASAPKQVLQAGVDRRALVGLVDHPLHLGADEVAGDEDAAGAAHVEHAREHVVVARVDVEAVDQREVVVVGLLDARRCGRAAPVRRAGRSACPIRCAAGCCRAGSAGRRRARPRGSGRRSRGGWAGCSTG